jgi:cytochrome c
MRRLTLLLALALATPAAAQEAPAHGGPVRAVLPLPGGLASAGFDQSMILWDAASGRARAVVRWHQGAVNALALLPDGRIASAGEDARIAIWGAATRTPEHVLEGHEAPIAALAAAPDGRLASAAWDGTARVWDVAAGTARVLSGHRGNVNGVAFRSDGLVATAGFDGTLRLWRGDVPETLAEFGFPQNTLAALPDGALLAGGVDGALRAVAADGAVREIEAGRRPVIALAVSPDGQRIAAGTIGGTVTLWSWPQARRLGELSGPGLPVWSVAFDAAGAVLLTGGADRRVRRWDAATGAPLGPLGPDTPDLGAAREGLDAHGAQVWRACSACHSLTAEGGNMAGPHLHALFDRRMGSVAGYEYSERLARGDIVWTRENVARLFTEGPDVMTPGTKMPVQRVGNAEDLAALLRFLEQATR